MEILWGFFFVTKEDLGGRDLFYFHAINIILFNN